MKLRDVPRFSIIAFPSRDGTIRGGYYRVDIFPKLKEEVWAYRMVYINDHWHVRESVILYNLDRDCVIIEPPE